MTTAIKQTDILAEFTKEEIIQWIREKGLFLRISRRDLLYIRWRNQSEQLQRDYDAELEHWDASKPDFSKRDALATQFNATKDLNERLHLLNKIAPYDKALKDHLTRTTKLDERQKKVDRLYKQLDETPYD